MQVEVGNVEHILGSAPDDAKLNQALQQIVFVRSGGPGPMGRPQPVVLGAEQVRELALRPGDLSASLQARREPLEPWQLVCARLTDVLLGHPVQGVADRYMVQEMGARGARLVTLDVGCVSDERDEGARQRVLVTVTEMVEDPGKSAAFALVRAHVLGDQSMHEGLRVGRRRELWHEPEHRILPSLDGPEQVVLEWRSPAERLCVQ